MLRSSSLVAINSWNSVCTQLVGVDPITLDDQPSTNAGAIKPQLVPDMLGCGYRALDPPVTVSSVALVEDLTLRNRAAGNYDQ